MGRIPFTDAQADSLRSARDHARRALEALYPLLVPGYHKDRPADDPDVALCDGVRRLFGGTIAAHDLADVLGTLSKQTEDLLAMGYPVPADPAVPLADDARELRSATNGVRHALEGLSRDLDRRQGAPDHACDRSFAALRSLEGEAEALLDGIGLRRDYRVIVEIVAVDKS